MNPLSTDFHLPETLPTVPGVKTQPAYERNKVEGIVKDYLTKNARDVNDDGSEVLIQFFETMSLDKDWVSKNTVAVAQVLRAVSLCFLTSEKPNVTEKIKNIVREKWSIFNSSAIPDFALNVLNGSKTQNDMPQVKTVKACSILLASRSPYFEKLFKSNMRESITLRSSYTLDPNNKMPGILMQDYSFNVVNAFVNILNGSTVNLNSWTKDDLHDLLRCADTTENMDYFAPTLEKILIEHITSHPENALQWYDFAIEAEGMPNLEVLCRNTLKDKLRTESATIYTTATKNNLRHLKELCCDYISEHIKFDDLTAFKGATTGTIPSHGYLEANDAKAICLNYLVLRLPEWMKEGFHKWDGSKRCFINAQSGPQKLLSTLKSISKKESSSEVVEKLNSFARLASEVKSIRSPYLKELSPQDLEWLLNQISQNTTALNLDSCKLTNLDILNRFVNLEVLSLGTCLQLRSLESLRNLTNLKDLNLTNCIALENIDALSQFKKLVSLNLEGVCYLKYYGALFSLPSLQVLNVKGCSENLQKSLKLSNSRITFNVLFD